MKCGLCGHEFSPEKARCSPACPVIGACPVICCPHCGYQTLDESRSAVLRLGQRVQGLLQRTPREGRERQSS